MSHTPTYDAKIKPILDTLQPRLRVCRLTGQAWDMTEREIGWYRQFNVPPSDIHPTVRLKFLLGFGAGTVLWKKPHAKTGQPILTFVHPDSPYQVVSDREWMDAEYLCSGPDADPGRPFFDQLRSLARSIPVGALHDDGSNQRSIGVDFIKCEDGYMVFGSGLSRRLSYAYTAYETEDSVDVANVRFSRFCHAVNRADHLYDCAFVFESYDCIGSRFLFDCRNCESCFGATNQRNKKYLWFNEQLTKEEWERRVAAVDLSSRTVFEAQRAQFLKCLQDAVWPPDFNHKSEDYSGEYMYESVRCHDGYLVTTCTDCDWCWITMEQEQSAFSTWLVWGSGIYGSCDSVSSQDLRFCLRIWRSRDMEYCINCYDCESCFGCVGLKRKKWCLFNVQYAEQEYWERVDVLKGAMLERGEYGRFFPADLSQNGFQFSLGDMFFGYSKEEMNVFHAPVFDLRRGGILVVSDTGIDVSALPDSSRDPEAASWIGKPIFDSRLQRQFTITSQEVDFYRSRDLPLPNEHFLSRLKKLVRLSNMPTQKAVVCTFCRVSIQAYGNGTFAERKVVCRPCYLRFLEQEVEPNRQMRDTIGMSK
ncbi:hypothetical protein HY734_03720 [Candidatus Uhrbacteria bacterium]|nr:hypothetical protein [Candidatus Uhrbacteria bacterium]